MDRGNIPIASNRDRENLMSQTIARGRISATGLGVGQYRNHNNGFIATWVISEHRRRGGRHGKVWIVGISYLRLWLVDPSCAGNHLVTGGHISATVGVGKGSGKSQQWAQ